MGRDSCGPALPKLLVSLLDFDADTPCAELDGLTLHRLLVRSRGGSFFDDDDLIGGHALERFSQAAGPANLQIGGGFRAQAEVKPGIIC